VSAAKRFVQLTGHECVEGGLALEDVQGAITAGGLVAQPDERDEAAHRRQSRCQRSRELGVLNGRRSNQFVLDE
jgi:hypothetical protein